MHRTLNKINSTHKLKQPKTVATYQTLTTNPVLTLMDENSSGVKNIKNIKSNRELLSTKTKTMNLESKKRYLQVSSTKANRTHEFHIHRQYTQSINKQENIHPTKLLKTEKTDRVNKRNQKREKKKKMQIPKYGKITLFRKLKQNTRKPQQHQPVQICKKLFPQASASNTKIHLSLFDKKQKLHRKGIQVSISKEKCHIKKKSIQVQEIEGDEYWEARVMHRSLQILHEYNSSSNSPSKPHNKYIIVDMQESRVAMDQHQKQCVKDRHIKTIVSPSCRNLTVR